jgi:hypothetical protein
MFRGGVSTAESLLARGEQPKQKKDKEGERKTGPPTDDLPKSQGSVAGTPAIQLLRHIVTYHSNRLVTPVHNMNLFLIVISLWH